MELTDTQINALPEDVFAGLTGLERLELTFNELTTLSEDVFDGLRNLRVLYLYQNKITELPEDLFDGLTNLGSLNLLYNDVAALPEDLFDGLTGLKAVAIHGNGLSSLPEEVFDGLSKLELLHLSGNKITALPADVFDGLGNLQLLLLHENQITGLPADVFNGLESLHTLTLYQNKISALPEGVFDGLGSLQTLDLSDNQISTLPAGAFEGIDGLYSLHLSDNPGAPFTFAAELEQKDSGFVVKVAQGAPFHVSVRLSADGGTLSTDTATVAAGSLESEIFTVTANEPDQPQVAVTVESAKFLGSASLTADEVSHSGIKTGPPVQQNTANICDRTQKVQDAVLAKLPGVTACGDVTVSDLAGIRTLSLSRMEITTLKLADFAGLSGLTQLYLLDNQLSTLPEGVFDGLGNLQLLFLHENQITGLPAEAFNGLESLHTLTLYQNKISALPEGVFDGLGSLQTLDLSDNQISTLPAGAFEGIDGLLNLDLSDNPGAPFTFAAELEQKDGGFVVKVAQGAPFHVSVRLSADGGALPTDTVTVAAGSLESEVITATANEPDQPQVTVNVESVKFLGSAEWAADLVRHSGIVASTGASLTLPVATTDRATVANTPATGAPTITGTPLAGQTLTADTSRIEDADGLTGVSFSYRWLLSDGDTDTEIEDATASTYTLTADDQGQAIKVRVVFTDDAGNEETLTSLAVAAVAPAPNTPAEGLPAISGTAQVGETLTSDTSGITDEDGLDNAAFSHQWIASDGSADADIQDATGSTYTLAVGDEGKTIKVMVTFTDDGGNEETLTSAATTAVEPAPNSPATGQPDISGTVQVGETLTANVSGIDDADGLDDAVFSYQWIRNDGTADTHIQDASDSTYVLDADDEGTTIKVRVTFTDDRGHGETLTSAATDTVAGLPPEPLTVSLENEADTHDGETPFTFELRFSEEFELSYKTLRDHAFTVVGGSVEKAKRLEKGSNIGWRITVQPDADRDVSITLPATEDCGDSGAICTEDGRRLSNPLEFTVSGPDS